MLRILGPNTGQSPVLIIYPRSLVHFGWPNDANGPLLVVNHLNCFCSSNHSGAFRNSHQSSPEHGKVCARFVQQTRKGLRGGRCSNQNFFDAGALPDTLHGGYIYHLISAHFCCKPPKRLSFENGKTMQNRDVCCLVCVYIFTLE